MKKRLLYFTYIVFCIWIGYKNLFYIQSGSIETDEIFLYYPSILISLPLSYVPFLLVKILNENNLHVGIISGYEYRFHFFIISFFLGMFQYFYLIPSFLKWLKKDKE